MSERPIPSPPLTASPQPKNAATLNHNLDIDLMERYGFVKKQRLAADRYLYEHVHAGMRYDHLFCAGCGKVVEFVSPGIEAMQREICRSHGFDPDQHTLQIQGLCLDCQAKRPVARVH